MVTRGLKTGFYDVILGLTLSIPAIFIPHTQATKITHQFSSLAVKNVKTSDFFR